MPVMLIAPVVLEYHKTNVHLAKQISFSLMLNKHVLINNVPWDLLFNHLYANNVTLLAKPVLHQLQHVETVLKVILNYKMVHAVLNVKLDFMVIL